MGGSWIPAYWFIAYSLTAHSSSRCLMNYSKIKNPKFYCILGAFLNNGNHLIAEWTLDSTQKLFWDDNILCFSTRAEIFWVILIVPNMIRKIWVFRGHVFRTGRILYNSHSVASTGPLEIWILVQFIGYREFWRLILHGSKI